MESGKGSKKKKNVLSLADLLAKKSQTTSGTQTRSKTLSLEDLKKQLNGNQGSSSNLNMSKALSVGVENMKLIDISQMKQEDPRSNKNAISANVLNQNNTNQSIHGKGNKQMSVKFENNDNVNIKSEYGHDAVNKTHREYARMVAKAEKEKFLNFDEEDNEVEESKVRTAGFNLLRLPKDLNLEKGRLNIYKSGIIEIHTNDPIPKVYRFKPTLFQTDSNPTTLVIATDSLAYLDNFEIYESSTLTQN